MANQYQFCDLCGEGHGQPGIKWVRPLLRSTTREKLEQRLTSETLSEQIVGNYGSPRQNIAQNLPPRLQIEALCQHL